MLLALRLLNGGAPAEFDQVVAALGRRAEHFRSYPAGEVELQLSVKARGTPSQRTTLEVWVAGYQRVVVTSSRADVDGARGEVRDERVRQLTDAENRTAPRHSRLLWE